MQLNKTLAVLALAFGAHAAQAETIRVAIGTQDPTINTATGGLVIRELKLLEKYLPKDGRYKDAQWDIQWKSFTSGPPLTNEQVAGKLDIGSMAEFPGLLNIVAHRAAGKKSVFINVISGSVQGSGNGIVVPTDSPVQTFSELKGKQISVPFGSTAHGVLLRAIANQGWDNERDVTLVSQAPDVGGSALKANKIDAHANFVPFPDLFQYRGFARKIYDGSQDKNATFHGTLVDADYAKKYPEVVVAYLRAVIEADRLATEDPEKISELIQKVTGIEAEVNYLFHGPLGLQTRDATWKPEFRAAANTALKTLRLLKKTDLEFDANEYIDDSFIRAAYKASGLDYDKRLKDYAKSPLKAKDAKTGQAITDLNQVGQVWIEGEPKVRHYTTPNHALEAAKGAEAAGKKVRVVYAHDRNTGIKLFAHQAWFVADAKGALSAFLLKSDAEAWAKGKGGKVLDFAAAKAGVVAAK
ncbi:ABC transporter substrate-binding protein [Azonexus sp. R2A61]|uniref:ABC transporter substrate-binding protein n=1 Tax=Azonexus sp. R2A61 TaxID=2744443 RepID=UPI001F4702E8|nr:ABC transporter substrate-binding protein [Azonexus sp. R2A61]